MPGATRTDGWAWPSAPGMRCPRNQGRSAIEVRTEIGHFRRSDHAAAPPTVPTSSATPPKKTGRADRILQLCEATVPVSPPGICGINRFGLVGRVIPNAAVMAGPQSKRVIPVEDVGTSQATSPNSSTTTNAFGIRQVKAISKRYLFPTRA